MIKKACCIGGIFILLFSCTSTEMLISDKSKDRIYFGKTGGFTNIPMEYVLIGKGYLFKIERDKYVKIHKLSSKQIKELDNLMAANNIEQLSLNEPGNITYFIKLVRSGSEKEIKWSDSSENSQIKELYNALLATVKE
jgi:hypothetical protein